MFQRVNPVIWLVILKNTNCRSRTCPLLNSSARRYEACSAWPALPRLHIAFPGAWMSDIQNACQQWPHLGIFGSMWLMVVNVVGLRSDVSTTMYPRHTRVAELADTLQTPGEAAITTMIARNTIKANHAPLYALPRSALSLRMCRSNLSIAHVHCQASVEYSCYVDSRCTQNCNSSPRVARQQMMPVK